MAKNGIVVDSSHMPCSVLSSLNLMRKSGTWCDLRLEVPSGDCNGSPSVLNVHACVVASASKTLAALVGRKLEHVVLKNLESDLISTCIDYIYGQDIFVPYEDVTELLKCAKTLQLTDLVNVCENELSKPEPEQYDPIISNFAEQTNKVEVKVEEDLALDMNGDSQVISDRDNQIGEQLHLEIIKTSSVASNFSSLSCSQCPLKFRDEKLLEEHERRHREGAAVPSLLQCSLCYFSATTRRQATLHKAWHHLTTDLRCDRCKLAFKIEIDLKKHVASKHADCVKDKVDAGVITEDQVLRTVNSTSGAQDGIEAGQEHLDLNIDTGELQVYLTHDSSSVDLERNNSECCSISRDASPEKLAVQCYKKEKLSKPSTSCTIFKKRRFSNSFCQTARHQRSKRRVDVDEFDFEELANELGVPQDVRPQLAPSEWPQHLKEGFKGKPKSAYKLHYINQFKDFTCEECGDTIRGKQRYDAHRRKEKGQYVYCSYCAKAFISTGSLRTHELRHRNQKDIKCKLCDVSFYYRHKLTKHMQNVHGELGGPVVHLCSQCPKTFRSAQSRTIHEVRVHMKDKWKLEEPVHRCEECQYVGFSKKDVDLHMAKHSNEKPHVCYICRRVAFKRPKELKKHIRDKHKVEPDSSQSGLTPTELLPPLPKKSKLYQCLHCDYTSLNHQNLKAHVIIHSDDRPFLCPICRLGFKRKNVMVRHAWRLHKMDLRSVCYERTETGKRKRKDLEPKLFFIDAPDMEHLVSGDVGVELLEAGANDVEQAIYASVDNDNETMLLTTDSDTYLRNLQLINADDTNKNVDINVIGEVVVDSGTIVVDGLDLSEQSGDTHTIAVPITDACGYNSQTQIVIDTNVLKSMGFENIAPQLRIVNE